MQVKLCQALIPWVEKVSERIECTNAKVILDWETIVGSAWASICRPYKVFFPFNASEKGVLYLYTSSHHVTTLAYSSASILGRVNRYYGYLAIERLLFRHMRYEPSSALPNHNDHQDRQAH